jgi:hypothetical protein
MRALLRVPLLLATLVLALPPSLSFGQARSSAVPSVPPAQSAAIRQAIEARFRQLDASAGMTLGSVATTAGRKGEAVLEVTVTPPPSQALETHAQTVYALVFETLAQLPGRFAGLSRIRLTLRRSPHGMTTDCPVKIVEDSLGYMTLATLRGRCVVR